jgi:hypothetical protein
MDSSVGKKQELSSRNLLAGAIKQRQAILFVGAGVSMAVGLPSWQTLIDHLLKELELDSKVIDGMNDGYQMLAEFYRLKQGGMGPLRSWLDRNWKVATDKVSQSELHKLIVELDFPAIYTTNYDRNLETAFEVHQSLMPRSRTPSISQTLPKALRISSSTMVISMTMHRWFLPRAIFWIDYPSIHRWISKFRADALGRTILFIGYSMSDPNIRLLLHSIWQTWENSGHRDHRPPSFVFMPSSNPVQEAILAHWGITLLTPESGSRRGDALTDFLADIRARIRDVDD